MYKLVSQEYWWPEMSTFIREYVDGCAVCQSTKSQPKTQIPLKPNEVPTNMWEIITIDFITDLPASKGYNLLLVVVDHLSKATILAPCNKTITAKETSQLYIDHIWKQTGLPKKVISDQGPQFVSKVMCNVTYGQYVLAFRDNPKRRLKGFLYLER
jgi:Integrase zinc binding domain/Integrase core domain